VGTVLVHCASGMQRVARKSRHRVADACDRVCAVLALNPEYGVVVKGHSSLRKMRVKAPGLTTGKSGGYRLIYSTAIVDESCYVALLALYYKGDQEDLSSDQYGDLEVEARRVLGNVIAHEWRAVTA